MGKIFPMVREPPKYIWRPSSENITYINLRPGKKFLRRIETINNSPGRPVGYFTKFEWTK